MGSVREEGKECYARGKKGGSVSILTRVRVVLLDLVRGGRCEIGLYRAVGCYGVRKRRWKQS